MPLKNPRKEFRYKPGQRDPEGVHFDRDILVVDKSAEMRNKSRRLK